MKITLDTTVRELIKMVEKGQGKHIRPDKTDNWEAFGDFIFDGEDYDGFVAIFQGVRPKLTFEREMIEPEGEI